MFVAPESVAPKMPLTDTQVKQARAGVHPEKGATDKPYKLSDGEGMYLEVTPAGGKYWRLKFRVAGKENRLSLGTYPKVSLKEARKRRDAERARLNDNIDPAIVRKTQKAMLRAGGESSFEAVAREWFARHKPTVSESHAERNMRLLTVEVFPFIGALPTDRLTGPIVLNGVLQRLAYGNATRKPVLEIAHRVKQLIGMILRYAVATGRAERDCTADLKGFLPTHKAKNLPAITDPKRVGDVLRAIADYKGSAVVRSALRLAPLLAVRPGNLRAMEWAEIDLEGGAWTIPAAKMKATKHEKETGQDFVVPLSAQAVAVLRELHPLTGHGKYCFPSNRGQSRFISDNAMNLALKSLGFSGQEQTVHGFRAMFRTMAAQELDEQDRYLEAALAHKPNDALGTSYNRTKFLEQRRRIMQTWANYLDKLKAGADVIPLHGSAA